MSDPQQRQLRVGALRPNQLLHTYGIGSVADLPSLSVMPLGLEHWELARATVITEDRLLAAMRAKLGHQVQALRLPPHLPETSDPYAEWARIGVPVALFPAWLRCSDTRCNRLAPVESGLFELVSAQTPDKVRYVHTCRGNGGGRPTAVPARFVLACGNGHLDDFPWSYFAHRGSDPGAGHPLQLSERGSTGETTNIFVTCDANGCHASRPISDAIGLADRNLPACRGRHPHLGSYEPCDATPRTLALGATNSWFAMQAAVFSVPKAEHPVDHLVAEFWPTLSVLAPLPAQTGTMILPTQTCWPELQPHGVDKVWAAIQRRHEAGDAPGGGDWDNLDLHLPEWRAFTASVGAALPDFTTRPEPVPAGHRDWLSQVVLVPRLRRVAALYGFTRIDAPERDVLDTPDQCRAPLSAEPPTWVPCAETRGEGIFLRFTEERIVAWEHDPAVKAREQLLIRAHDKWRAQRQLPPGAWPGLRYLLLHTLAHTLIRELALECGYSASGIGERVYARTGDSPMAGVLLYTAAPDSEGTLGGLVTLGRADRLGPLIDRALHGARLCSSDPLCAEHDPTVHGRLAGAACHACLYAAETSCEGGNHYLDRSLLVDTLADSECGFCR
ncbi:MULTISPECIES: DrmB family protein [unclassified Micromonospora]|uniref:DrmB family protein n=1 Tax=unclassified Micromonospora TaxID=2617518 RepID=UPI003A83E699